jgi:hypothetical protein
VTPQRPRQSLQGNGGQRGGEAGGQSQLTPTPTPLNPGRKMWYDRLADVLLGDEADEGVRAASTRCVCFSSSFVSLFGVLTDQTSRYALICEQCFAHNGLVKESMWEDARESPKEFFFWSVSYALLRKKHLEYTCPKCGYFNASARSKRSPISPSVSVSISAASPSSPDMSMFTNPDSPTSLRSNSQSLLSPPPPRQSAQDGDLGESELRKRTRAEGNGEERDDEVNLMEVDSYVVE